MGLLMGPFNAAMRLLYLQKHPRKEKRDSEREKSDAEKRVSHHVVIGQETGGVGPQQIAA
ncbi:MAG: hypothetical protein BRD43_07070 [Bacteroidetes bacterium QS_4_64_154]|nr:MAG: hypothetical protein BRD43_07070 [Bacteroidetes bacterium QS_4_64_154]